jgi:hypothetical protein
MIGTLIGFLWALIGATLYILRKKSDLVDDRKLTIFAYGPLMWGASFSARRWNRM